MPVEVIVPKVELPFGMPFTDHVTFVSGLPALFTDAVSCNVLPVRTSLPEGLLWMVTVISLVIVTEVLAAFVVSAWLVAAMVTVAGVGRSAGAV